MTSEQPRRVPAGDQLLRDVAVVLATMVAVGVVAGVVWAVAFDPIQFVRLDDRVGQDELALSADFGMTGSYFLVAVVAGGLCGAALGWWRDHDPLVTLGLLVLGSVVAAFLMKHTGQLLGPADPTAMLQASAVGARADAPLKLEDEQALLAWPIGSLVGLLIPLLGRSD